MKNTTQKILAVLAGVAIPILFLLLMPTGFALDGTIQGLESTYNNEHRVLVDAIKTHCNTEIELAKKKLEYHYAGKLELNSDDIARLTEKSEGSNLTCLKEITS